MQYKCILSIDEHAQTAYRDALFQNTMRTVAIQVIICTYSIWLKSVYTSENPLEAIKSQLIWDMFVGNKNREYLQLKYPQPLPENKWPNYLLMNFTRLKVNNTQTIMIMLKQCYLLTAILIYVNLHRTKQSFIQLRVSVIK